MEKVYGADPNADIFDLRGLSRDGVVVVVRPDQYVANVLPLTATAELAAFFAPLLPDRKLSSAVRPLALPTVHADRALKSPQDRA